MIGTAMDRIDTDPAIKSLYAALLDLLAGLGEIAVESKKTSLHVTAGSGTPAFLGVHPRSGGLLLNIVTDGPITSGRVRKREQLSRSRCHNEALITTATELDDELRSWLQHAYARVT